MSGKSVYSKLHGSDPVATRHFQNSLRVYEPSNGVRASTGQTGPPARFDGAKRTSVRRACSITRERSSHTLQSKINGTTKINGEIKHCSGYSFVVPLFSSTMIDGAAYRKLVDDIIALFGAHLRKCEILLEKQANLPDLVAESVRVAVGRTQLLMKKRLTQFNQQLERHLKPVAGEKETTLNDLHGLWSLVDIQLGDIRHCFEDVEESRLSGWKAPAAPKQTLTTASSMPSLRLAHAQPPATPISSSSVAGSSRALNNGKPLHKLSADETSTKENLAREKTVAAAKRRQDENRKRQEFIRAKRAELASRLSNNDNVQTDIIDC